MMTRDKNQPQNTDLATQWYIKNTMYILKNPD